MHSTITGIAEQREDFGSSDVAAGAQRIRNTTRRHRPDSDGLFDIGGPPETKRFPVGKPGIASYEITQAPTEKS